MVLFFVKKFVKKDEKKEILEFVKLIVIILLFGILEFYGKINDF